MGRVGCYTRQGEREAIMIFHKPSLITPIVVEGPRSCVGAMRVQAVRGPAVYEDTRGG